MSKAAMLFNGIRFPFSVIDQAFEWVKSVEISLLAVYLITGHEVSDGYPFPNDLNIAENLSDDAEIKSDNAAIIESNMRMLKNRAELEGISFEAVVLVDPSVQDLSECVKECQYIFIDEKIDEMIGSNIDINILKWSAAFSGSVKTIR